MSREINSVLHASRPKAPAAAVLYTVIFLLIAAGAPIFTFLYYTPSNGAQQIVNIQMVSQSNETEAHARQGEDQAAKVRVFDGVLEWFDGSKWTPYAKLDTLRAGDPIAAAQRAMQADSSERSAGTLPLLPMRGEVKQERLVSDSGDDGGSVSHDGNAADANDLF